MELMGLKAIYMNANTYNSLTFNERASLLCRKGVYVDSIYYNSHWIDLYSVSCLFVEVYFNESTCRIENIRVADNGELIKFLEPIKLGVI